jgi:hypothetical protein
MATALDLINKALHLCGAKDPLEDATAKEASDGLASLNNMLDSWSTDRLFVYQVAKYNYAWPAGASSRTVGVGGDIPISRPLKVEGGYIVDNSITYPLQMINREGYDSIPQKTLQVNYPEWLYYDPGFPLGTLYIYTVPASTLQTFINYWLMLQTFTTLTDVVSLPPGYERAITFNLAVEISAEYNMKISPAVAAVAASSAGKIKRLNAPPVTSVLEVAYSPAQWEFSIYRGY